MSIAILVLGESGTGKSTSLKNMNPAETLLVQTIQKPLPFRSKDWRPVSRDGGNIVVSADYAQIVTAMEKTSRPIVVIDDFQYLMAVEFMARVHEKGYDKFNDLASHYYAILTKASSLAPHKRVYMLSHTDTNEQGVTRAKTIGKLVNEKLTVEGFVSIVLRTQVINGRYVFSTRNNGADTTKTPLEMFADEHIDNDLAAVDAAVVEYYSLSQTAAA